MAKQTQTKNQAPAAEQARTRQDVAVLQPARLPYHPVYQERYGIDGMMWRALVEAVYPSAKTVEGIILAVSYCRSKNYDVMKKMVHVVPIWNSALKKEVEGVWEAVAALRATAFRTGEYAGCDETKFGPVIKKHFAGTVGHGQYEKHVEMDLEFPEWAQVTVYRIIQGMRCAFPGPKVTFLGAYGAQGKSDVPNEKWAEGPSYMLEKCAEAAALRKAFPEALGSTNAAEEMEGRKIDLAPSQTIDHEPVPPRPTRQDSKSEAEAARKQAYEMDRQYRDTMGGGEAEAESHDPETGEIHQGAAPHDEPEQTTEDASPQHVDSGPQETQQDVAPAVDYSPLANQIIAEIQKTGMLGTLHNLHTKSRAREIALLKEHAPELYQDVMNAIEQRRQWFAR